jgi:hypothetical protein
MKLSFIKQMLLLIAIFTLFVFAITPKLQPEKNALQKMGSNIFTIDTAKSILHWKAMVHSGTIKFDSGFLSFLNNQPDEALFHINMKSMTNTDVENDLLRGTLENVLKSEVLFDVSEFPQSHFELHSSTLLSENSYHFSGDFILFENGICTDFEGKIEVKGDSLYFTTDFIPLNRTDWGMYYLSKNNLYPLEEEENMEVPDSIFVQSKIVLFAKN